MSLCCQYVYYIMYLLLFVTYGVWFLNVACLYYISLLVYIISSLLQKGFTVAKHFSIL